MLLTGLFSIGMFAIPASMLTWGFEAEAARVASKTRKRHLRTLAGEPADSSSSSSSSSSENDAESSCSSSDEEYLKLIAGDDEDGKEQKDGNDVQETLENILDALSSREATPSSLEVLDRIAKLEAKVDKILKLMETNKVL